MRLLSKRARIAPQSQITLSGKNLLKLMLGEQIVLPERVWLRLNFAWGADMSEAADEASTEG